MQYSTHWLQDYFATKLPNPEKLGDLLSLHIFEVEDIAKHKDDAILNIDVLPNRGHDCLNHIGIAREIAALTGKKMRPVKTKRIVPQKGTLKPLTIAVESSDLVPRYTALVIEGIELGKSPKKVQKYLATVGVNSINNVVDLTNFVMLEMGQPLHAFDYDTVKSSQMTIRKAYKGEKLETLAEQELVLPKGVIIIEDGKRLIDLAGIKGGKVSGISSKTKNIILQAANFNAQAIYKAKKELKYTTQAADIYSHTIDPNLTVQALERANQLLQEWGIKGKVVQFIDIYPKKVVSKKITLEIKFVERVLGIEIPQNQIKKMLESLDCKVTVKKGIFEVEIPTRRIDLSIPEDLIEEIGRLYGYERIPSILPVASLALPKIEKLHKYSEHARDALKELGFTEIYNYSFVGENDLQIFAYTESERENLITLENPISEDFASLRDSLLEHLLRNVSSNQKKFESLQIFEIGNVFSKKNKKFEETKIVSGVMLNQNFYEAKSVVDFLLQSFGISTVWYDEYKATPEKSRQVLWHKGKSAEVKIGASSRLKAGNEEIGFIGEISPRITTNLKITKPVVAFHLSMEKIMQLASPEREYQPLSKFPSVARDIAMLTPTDTKASELMNIMNTAGKKLIYDIDLFDMYEAKNLPEGKKSLAFRIIYQATDRTLTNKEVDKIHDKIINAIEQNLQWEVRK